LNCQRLCLQRVTKANDRELRIETCSYIRFFVDIESRSVRNRQCDVVTGLNKTSICIFGLWSLSALSKNWAAVIVQQTFLVLSFTLEFDDVRVLKLHSAVVRQVGEHYEVGSLSSGEFPLLSSHVEYVVLVW
jgi:hypothetical protein